MQYATNKNKRQMNSWHPLGFSHFLGSPTSADLTLSDAQIFSIGVPSPIGIPLHSSYIWTPKMKNKEKEIWNAGEIDKFWKYEIEIEV